MSRRVATAYLFLTGFLAMVAVAIGTIRAGPDESSLAQQVLADRRMSDVLNMARHLLREDVTAGGGYREVWIRDLNTFIEIALEVNDPSRLRDVLLTFAKFQGTTGDIPDAYVPVDQAKGYYRYRSTSLAPGLLAHKNTGETDQESSLVQAVAKYVRTTGDRSILSEVVGGQTVRDRLGRALDSVLQTRVTPAYGLIWGGTTADWGDLQPEYPGAVDLDERSHRAVSIYANAMFVIAVNDYVDLLGEDPAAARWRSVRADLKRRIRTYLWNPSREQFVPHLYLSGSPFPDTLNENAIYYHGGTTVAIEADLLTRDETARALGRMRADVQQAGAGSIGLTLYPPYPDGAFRSPGMGPFAYQNGGDWCWFGGRMVQQLIRQGLMGDAYRELLPMVVRVERAGGFYEWWSRDNQPRGSGEFRGSAGVLGLAIERLDAWATPRIRRSRSEHAHAGTADAPATGR